MVAQCKEISVLEQGIQRETLAQPQKKDSEIPTFKKQPKETKVSILQGDNKQPGLILYTVC